MKIPKDPYLAVSVLNTALRDGFGSLEDLLAEAEEDREKLEERLLAAGFYYDRERNCFREKE